MYGFDSASIHTSGNPILQTEDTDINVQRCNSNQANNSFQPLGNVAPNTRKLISPPSMSGTFDFSGNYDGQYDDFDTIDWVKDIARDRDRHRNMHSNKHTKLGFFKTLLDSASGWVCVLLVGIVVGIIAGFIDIGSTWASDLKEGVCLDAFWLNKEQCCWSSTVVLVSCSEWFTWSRLFISQDPEAGNHAAYFIGYITYICWALLFSSLCVLLVKIFAPYACGSGIPEIKTILSGFLIRGYLGKWTLLIKSIGMVLGVSAGLSLGKEGPMVHMAACCGNIIAHLFPKYGRNEAKKREILSASAAAGVAVAFGAPIGGVLFSLEEASYYFPMKTLFRSFFCAMISANVLRMMNPYGDDHLVMFYVDYKADWHIVELVIFAFLGMLGGIYGCIFNKSNLLICRFRKNSKMGQYPVKEVLIVTFVTALVSFPHKYLRINAGELIRLLVSRCAPGDTIDLCDYHLNGTDHTAQVFWPAGDQMGHAMVLLAIALVLKTVITIFTFGIKVPTGLFIPSLAAGAMMGRMLGVGMEQLVVKHANHPVVAQICKSTQPCINPGLYAIIGAAAFLGGVTRMTISLVVVMLELTGGLNYIIPLMVAAMVSKWTGDRLTNGSIYEEHIRLNNYPYLSSHDTLTHISMAADVMQPSSKGPTSTGNSSELQLKVLTQDSMTVGEIEYLLSRSEVKGFPLIVSRRSYNLVGWVTRRDLVCALERERQYDGNITVDTKVYFTDEIADDSALGHGGTEMINLKSIVDYSPITVTDQTPMDTLLDFFRKLGLRQCLVTHNGRVLGIITKKDILLHVVQHARH